MAALRGVSSRIGNNDGLELARGFRGWRNTVFVARLSEGAASVQ
jgi:hypothetical protein